MADVLALKDPVTGAIVRIPDDDKAEETIQAQGLQLASEEEIDLWDKQQLYGGGGQTVLGAAEKAVRGATFGGVPGLVGTEEEQRQRAQVLERDAPLTSMAAGLAPDVGIALATGGVGGLMTGAGRAAAKQAGGGLLRRGLAAGAAGLTKGSRGAAAGILGAESALTGITAEAEQAFVADREFSAEAAMANGALNFVLGGIPLVGARALRGRARPKMKRNLLPETETKAGLPKSPDGTRAKSGGAAAAADYDSEAAKAIKSIEDQGLDNEAIFLSQNSDALTDLTTLNISDTFDSVYRKMDDKVSYATKADDFVEGAKGWTDDMVKAQDDWVAASVATKGDEVIEALDAAKAAGFNGKGLMAGSKEIVQQHKARIARVAGSERNLAVDQLKRSVWSQIKRIQRSAARPGGLDQDTAKKMIGILRPYGNELMDGLEDVAKWGNNAKMQRPINAAWSQATDPLKRINRTLSEVTGEKFGEVGASSVNRRAKARAVSAALKESPAMQREFAADLADALDGIDQLAEARQRNGLTNLDGLDEMRAEVLELKRDFNFGATLNVAKSHAKRLQETKPSLFEAVASEMATLSTTGIPGMGRGARNVWKTISQSASMPKPGTPLRNVLDNRMSKWTRLEAMQDPSFARTLPPWVRQGMAAQPPVRPAGPGVAQAGPGVPPPSAPTGAAAPPGAAQAGFATPTAMGGGLALGGAALAAPVMLTDEDKRTAQALNNIAGGTREKVDGMVRGLFDTAKGGKPRVPAAQKRLVKRAEQLGESVTMTRFVGRKDQDPLDAFDKKRATIQQMASDPQELIERMAESWGDLPSQQPEVFQRMMIQTTRVVGYLAENLPDNTSKTLMNPDGFDPTHEELEEYAGRWQGATQPTTVLDDIASGDVSEEAIEAVKANWPGLFAQYQTAALGGLEELRESGTEVARAELEYLDSVLELEGAGEPLLGWDLANLIEQAGKAAPEQPGTNTQPSQKPIDTAAPERLSSAALGALRGTE